MSPIEIEISPLAFAKIMDWTASNTEREIGGYLVGKIESGKVIINEAIFAAAESNPTYVSLDNMIQFSIIEEIERKGSNDSIIGWFHTHPSYGCFMSGTDVGTQKIYQALLPEAIAMVNDGNVYARSRNQKDYKVKFFRVNDKGKAYELSFNVMTDPNNLLELLTKHVQDQENAEKIAEVTARHMALTIDDSLRNLTENKLLLKEQFSEDVTIIKEDLISIRSDIANLKRILVTIEDFNSFKKSREKESVKLTTLVYVLLGLISATLIFSFTVFLLLLIG
ncbi:MAG: Mov34/MPN/PAD-1 family protein [Candidatus Thorarchaeota archaeon]